MPGSHDPGIGSFPVHASGTDAGTGQRTLVGLERAIQIASSWDHSAKLSVSRASAFPGPIEL